MNQCPHCDVWVETDSEFYPYCEDHALTDCTVCGRTESRALMIFPNDGGPICDACYDAARVPSEHDALVRVTALLRESWAGDLDCDHSVNICRCGIRAALADADAAIAKGNAP